MMTRVLAVILIFTMGCGTVLNGGSATLVPPRGGTVDGSTTPIAASKKIPHEVVYPDGRRCIIESNVSAGYVIADVVLLLLLGVIIDAVTGDWKVLNADACPGVIVN
jgi:hypothetical protein